MAKIQLRFYIRGLTHDEDGINSEYSHKFTYTPQYDDVERLKKVVVKSINLMNSLEGSRLSIKVHVYYDCGGSEPEDEEVFGVSNYDGKYHLDKNKFSSHRGLNIYRPEVDSKGLLFSLRTLFKGLELI